MSPRVKPKGLKPETERLLRTATRERPEKPTSAEAWADIGIRPKDKEAQRIYIREDSPYAPDSPYSFFCDLIASELAKQNDSRTASALGSLGTRDARALPQLSSVDVGEARRRLAHVAEQRDVVSGDPGAASFLGPGFVGSAFNLAARAEGSLAAALGLRPLPRGVKQINIPRFDTGASAAVQNPEGSGVSQTDVDAGSQAGNIATVAGLQDLSLQALEFIDGAADEALAMDLGRAIGSAMDVQLAAGSNASGQTLGLASVTGAKAVTWTDASPTSQEFVGQTWKAYDSIANGGEGVADPNEYLVVMHPRRLAWSYHNAQNAQSVRPAVPGSIVACAGLRTTLGGGTEDEVFVIVPSELPAYASDVRLIVDVESQSGNAQVRLVASRYLATGFGRAPAAISRISGTGLVAPVL